MKPTLGKASAYRHTPFCPGVPGRNRGTSSTKAKASR